MERIKRSEIELEDDNLFFINDKPITGTLFDVYKNGQLLYEKTIVNSVLEGLCQHWYPDGKIKSAGIYQKSKKEGKWKTFFANGQLSTSTEYINGHIVVKKSWDELGNFIEELNTDFKEGGKTAHTHIQRWNVKGKKIEEMETEYGIILSKKSWNENGDLIEHYIFEEFHYDMLYL